MNFVKIKNTMNYTMNGEAIAYNRNFLISLGTDTCYVQHDEKNTKLIGECKDGQYIIHEFACHTYISHVNLYDRTLYVASSIGFTVIAKDGSVSFAPSSKKTIYYGCVNKILFYRKNGVNYYRYNRTEKEISKGATKRLFPLQNIVLEHDCETKKLRIVYPTIETVNVDDCGTPPKWLGNDYVEYAGCVLKLSSCQFGNRSI